MPGRSSLLLPALSSECLVSLTGFLAIHAVCPPPALNVIMSQSKPPRWSPPGPPSSQRVHLTNNRLGPHRRHGLVV